MKTQTKLNKDDIKKTLLDESEDIKKTLATMDKTTVKQAKQVASELALLKEANQVQTNALQSNEEIASGTFPHPFHHSISKTKYYIYLPYIFKYQI